MRQKQGRRALDHSGSPPAEPALTAQLAATHPHRPHEEEKLTRRPSAGRASQPLQPGVRAGSPTRTLTAPILIAHTCPTSQPRRESAALGGPRDWAAGGRLAKNADHGAITSGPGMLGAHVPEKPRPGAAGLGPAEAESVGRRLGKTSGGSEPSRGASRASRAMTRTRAQLC